MKRPRISVLVSSYNNARFVAKKLAEIRAQTVFDEAEFLFIETASPEREREMFAPFCKENSNCRVLVTEERRTLYEAWNFGWRAAQAPLLCYTNMDDAMHPALLEEVIATMDAPSVIACTTLIAKQPLDDGWNDWTPARIATLPLSTRFGAFAAWQTNAGIGGFDERYIAAGDKEFWHRLNQSKGRVRLIPKILYLYTRNPGSLSVAARSTERWEREKTLLKENTVRWPSSLRWKVRLIRARRLFQPNYGIVPATQ